MRIMTRVFLLSLFHVCFFSKSLLHFSLSSLLFNCISSSESGQHVYLKKVSHCYNESCYVIWQAKFKAINFCHLPVPALSFFDGRSSWFLFFFLANQQKTTSPERKKKLFRKKKSDYSKKNFLLLSFFLFP